MKCTILFPSTGVSTACALRGINKLQKNRALWALLSKEPDLLKAIATQKMMEDEKAAEKERKDPFLLPMYG